MCSSQSWHLLAAGPHTLLVALCMSILPTTDLSPVQTDIIAVQRVYYNQSFSFGYQWMLVMSTQLIGFSIGGLSRRFLVAPPSMSMSSLSLRWALLLSVDSCLVYFSMACELGHLCAIQHASLSRIHWNGKSRWLVPRAIFHCLHSGGHRILWVPLRMRVINMA